MQTVKLLQEFPAIQHRHTKVEEDNIRQLPGIGTNRCQVIYRQFAVRELAYLQRTVHAFDDPPNQKDIYWIVVYQEYPSHSVTV
jgi:hypothetical protein